MWENSWLLILISSFRFLLVYVGMTGGTLPLLCPSVHILCVCKTLNANNFPGLHQLLHDLACRDQLSLPRLLDTTPTQSPNLAGPSLTSDAPDFKGDRALFVRCHRI